MISSVLNVIHSGLSPPTRGNRYGKPPGVCGFGSIPAHAGEPDAPIAFIRTPEVYPRPRGGTTL